MVHANLDVPGRQERTASDAEEVELHPGSRERIDVHPLLVRFEPGYERVGVDRHPVRSEVENGFDAPCERLGILQRQAVDEVEIDGSETQSAAVLVELSGLGLRLIAIDGRLYFRREILNSDGDSVEAQPAEETGYGIH